MKRWLILLCASMAAAGLLVRLHVQQQPPAPAIEARRPGHPAFPSWLQRLAHECEPGNFDAEYAWSTTAVPTEKHREALLAEVRPLGEALLPDVKAEMQRTPNDELRSMLLVVAVALGDKDSIVPAAKTMVWSDFPAVRLSAARELRRLHDPRTIEWFQAALQDERFVHNCDCQKQLEKYYPVRTVAEIALREMGVTMSETAQR